MGKTTTVRSGGVLAIAALTAAAAAIAVPGGPAYATVTKSGGQWLWQGTTAASATTDSLHPYPRAGGSGLPAPPDGPAFGPVPARAGRVCVMLVA